MHKNASDDTDRSVEKRIKAAYDSDQVPADLWGRIRTTVDGHSPAKRTAAVWPQLRLAHALLAVSLMIGAGAVMITLKSAQPPLPPTVESAAEMSLPDALASEFATFVASGRSFDITSSDADALSGWFSSRLDKLPPRAPKEPGLSLAGGRLCQIQNKRVASYVYRLNETLLSLYITKVDAGTTPAISPGPHQLTISEANGYTHATWRHSGWRYSLVADMPTPKIAEIAAQMSARLYDPRS